MRIHWRKKRKKMILSFIKFLPVVNSKIWGLSLDAPKKRILGGVYMRKLAPAWVSHRDDFFISDSVYMMTESFHISLFEGTLHVDKIHVWFKIANITHALPVPVYRQTDFTPKRLSSRVYMIPLRDFVPEWNSRPGTATGVTRAGMTFCGGIM